MAVLVRIAMIILAYILACIAASLILTIGTLTPEWDDLTALGLQSVTVWAVVMVGAAAIAVQKSTAEAAARRFMASPPVRYTTAG